MASCPGLSNVTVPGSNITWGEALSHAYGSSVTSYFRPDTGVALLPWIYTTIILIYHIPVLLVRVVRWQAAQSWCLAATFLLSLYT